MCFGSDIIHESVELIRNFVFVHNDLIFDVSYTILNSIEDKSQKLFKRKNGMLKAI